MTPSRRHPALAATLALITIAGCPKAPLGPDPASTGDGTELEQLRSRVARLSADVEALLRHQDELVWKSWMEGTSLDLTRTYQGRQFLFSTDAIGAVRRLGELSTDDAERAAMGNLEVYLVGEHLAQQASEATEAVANLERSLTFTFEGKEHPYGELPRMLSRERSTPRRRALWSAAVPSIDRLTTALRRRNERLTQALNAIGHPSYEAYGSQLRGVDLADLAVQAEQLLATTQPVYGHLLGELAQRELQLPATQLRLPDLERLFRPRLPEPAAFPRDQLLLRAERTLEAMGLSLRAVPGLTLELRPLPKKNPRPLSLAVKVPGDVRVSLRPVEGLRDQATLLHELGHALSLAHARPQRFELNKLGSPTTSEGWAWLTEDLAGDPGWLTGTAALTQDTARQLAADLAAQRLYQLRRAAAALLFELELHRLGPERFEEARGLYRQIFSRALGVPLGPADDARYLVEASDFYESADTLRAWMLAGCLADALRARAGPTWWADRRSGELLHQLWAQGPLPPEELLRGVGHARLSWEPVAARLGRRLGQLLEGTPDGGGWRPGVFIPPRSTASAREGAMGGGPDGGTAAAPPGGARPMSADAGAADSEAWRPGPFALPRTLQPDTHGGLPGSRPATTDGGE